MIQKPQAGAGVVRFWSAKDFFGHAVTRQRPAVRTICFKVGSECLKRLNAAERRWQRVAIAACDVRKEISRQGMKGIKKPAFAGYVLDRFTCQSTGSICRSACPLSFRCSVWLPRWSVLPYCCACGLPFALPALSPRRACRASAAPR